MSLYVPGKEPPCPGGSPNCKKIITNRGTKQCSECYNYHRRQVAAPPVAPAEAVIADRQRSADRTELATLRARYKESLRRLDATEAELAMARRIADRMIEPLAVKPRKITTNDNEACAVYAISDWHSEEIVNPNTINNRNEHNVEIHRARQTRFWQKALGLFKLIEAGVKVPTIVLALLGDFISNEIHDADSAESTELRPIDAMMMVEDEIAGGINFLLTHTKSDIIVDCHSGNHARTTHKVRIANESGHSLEFYAYTHLARLFANEPRVSFRVNVGYHSFLDIYDIRVRFHHGHWIKYNGGVGGLTIPTNKAIAQWNKEAMGEKAPALDIFGHYHQAFDGGNFVCNGSMIGYNAFAKSIKASYEPPKQMMLVIDKKHGRTCTWPIYVQKGQV